MPWMRWSRSPEEMDTLREAYQRQVVKGKYWTLKRLRSIEFSFSLFLWIANEGRKVLGRKENDAQLTSNKSTPFRRLEVYSKSFSRQLLTFTNLLSTSRSVDCFVNLLRFRNIIGNVLLGFGLEAKATHSLKCCSEWRDGTLSVDTQVNNIPHQNITLIW